MRSIICDWCEEEYYDPNDHEWKCDKRDENTCPLIEKFPMQNKNSIS